MKQKIWMIGLLLVGLVLIVLLSAWGARPENADNPLPKILLAIVVFLGAVGALAFRRRGERRDLTAETDSVEARVSLKARADLFSDTLVLLAAAGLALVVFDKQLYPAVVVFAVLVILVADFWIRFMIQKSKVM